MQNKGVNLQRQSSVQMQGWSDSLGSGKPLQRKSPPTETERQQKQKEREFAFIQQVFCAQHEPGVTHTTPHLVLPATLAKTWQGQRTPDRYDHLLCLTIR